MTYQWDVGCQSFNDVESDHINLISYFNGEGNDSAGVNLEVVPLAHVHTSRRIDLAPQVSSYNFISEKAQAVRIIQDINIEFRVTACESNIGVWHISCNYFATWCICLPDLP